MTVSSALLEALEARANLSRRQVNRLITAKAHELFLTRELAAIIVAQEFGVGVSKFASGEDLATIRQVLNGSSGNGALATPSLASAQPSERPARRKVRKAAAPRTPRRPSGSKKNVFVVHGRNEKLRKSMFAFLRSIGLLPLEWSLLKTATGSGSPYIGEVLEAAFDRATAVVVLLTPDDEAQLKEKYRKRNDKPYESVLTGQARPNVLFEAGMAFGRHPDRTILVQVGDLREFSDVGGRAVIHMTGGRKEARHDLAERLRTAGCAVETKGTDWLSEGRFVL
jgi:predicted nucleotide-binding protein